MQFGFVKTQAVALPRRTTCRPVRSRASPSPGCPTSAARTARSCPRPASPARSPAARSSSPWIALSDLGAGDAADLRRPRRRRRQLRHQERAGRHLPTVDLGRRPGLHPVELQRRGRTTASVTDVGNKMIVGWFTHVYGKVFIDSNGNGKQDPGEKRGPAVRPDRARARQLADGPGHQHRDHRQQRRLRHPRDLPAGQVAGPRGVQHPVQDHRHHLQGRERDQGRPPSWAAWSTSTSCRSSGSAARSTGASSLTTPATNGGIVGTVTYDTTRNELDPADAATEPYQPGIPDVPVNLYVPKACTAAAGRAGQRVPPGLPDRAAAESRTRATRRTMINNPAADRGALRQGPGGPGRLHLGEVAAAARLHGPAVQRRRR